jgi:hypothetical protein
MLDGPNFVENVVGEKKNAFLIEIQISKTTEER